VRTLEVARLEFPLLRSAEHLVIFFPLT